MLLLLIGCIIVALILPLLSTDYIWYDKKNGLKYTLTDFGLTTEWDYKSPLTLLRLLHLALQCERNPEQRNKFIEKYNKLKKSLENEGYDVSNFRDYEIK